MTASFEWVQKRILLLALIVIGVQFLLFMAYISTQIAPYYPAASDQLVTYNAVYQAYYAIQDHGLAEAIQTDLAIKQGVFKGWIVPLLGLGFALLLGPSRETIVITNFVFFVIGQIAVWRFLSRRYNVSSALLGWGLFLLSGTHYFWAGGMDDLRFDYAGMIVFGIGFMLLLSIYETPTRRKFWLFVLILGVAASTRSITMVYLVGMVGLLFLWSSGKWLVNRDEASNWIHLEYFFLLGAASALVAGIFIVANWGSISDYYVNLKVSAEDAIRKSEGGVSSLLDLLFYYPRTAIPHFADYVLIATISTGLWFGVQGRRRFTRRVDWRDIWQIFSPIQIILGAVVCVIYIVLVANTPSLRIAIYAVVAAVSIVILLGLWSQRLPKQTTNWQEIRRRVSPTLIVSSAAVLAFYIAATSYSPSPVVVGVLTIPIVITVTLLLVEAWAPLLSEGALQKAALAFALLGLFNYSYAMVLPKRISPAAQGDGIVANRLMADLARVTAGRTQTTIYWMLVQPAFTSLGFNIYLYEHNAWAGVPRLNQMSAPIFSASEKELVGNLASADVVIAYSPVPPQQGFEYPYLTSLRALESVWRGYLDQHYSNEGIYAPNNALWQVGLFVRTDKPGN